MSVKNIMTSATAVLLLAGTALAQNKKVEISGFGGYTLSEGFTIDPVDFEGERYDKINATNGVSYGFTFGVFATENVSVEFLYSQHDSALEAKGRSKLEFADLKVNNYHGLLVYNWGEDDGGPRPFLFGGLGATNYSPGEVNGRAIEGETRFSSTWGGGLKLYAGETLGVKVMGRWTPTYIKSDASGIWCSPYWPWACYVVGEADYANQLELSGGITLRF